MTRVTLRLGAGFLAAVLSVPLTVHAQVPPAGAGAQSPPPASGSTTRPSKSPGKESAAPTATAGSDGALRKRVEQLEEQLVDLQVVIGTLESLAKAPRASAAGPSDYRPSGGGASDDARLEGIELQVRALTQQMEQLSEQVRGQRSKGDAAALPPASGTFQPNAAVMGGPASRPAPAPAAQPDPIASRDEAAAMGDAIGGILANEALPPVSTDAPGALAALPPAGDDPKTAYDTAFAHMLQSDFGAAQVSFGEFLRRYPQHALIPNALYWLGEVYYAQKDFSNAAEAFDVVLSAHATSDKAPGSQLKKAMSLAHLGKIADACSALRQLAVKYPRAPNEVKSKADSERRRVGCT